jgi:hypothetical protein
LHNNVSAKILERQANRFLISGRDGVNGNKKGNSYPDAQDIYQGTVMVVAKLFQHVVVVHDVLTSDELAKSQRRQIIVIPAKAGIQGSR